jgi:hypothetical protein
LISIGAELVFRQLGEAHRRSLVYRPVETGGFLALEARGNSCDFVAMRFAAMGTPVCLDEAPDFSGDFEFELRGVQARVTGTRPLVGELAPARWRWCREFNRVSPHGVDLGVLRAAST